MQSSGIVISYSTLGFCLLGVKRGTKWERVARIPRQKEQAGKSFECWTVVILADCQSVRQILSNRCCPSRRGARPAMSGEAAERHHRRGRTSNRSDGGGGRSANENREGDENEMVKMAERAVESGGTWMEG